MRFCSLPKSEILQIIGDEHNISSFQEQREIQEITNIVGKKNTLVKYIFRTN